MASDVRLDRLVEGGNVSKVEGRSGAVQGVRSIGVEQQLRQEDLENVEQIYNNTDTKRGKVNSQVRSEFCENKKKKNSLERLQPLFRKRVERNSTQ